jgi:DNA-binding NtrC family response regulator
MSKILLVEDSESLREVLACVLRTDGHEVTAFEEAESAYKYFKDHPCDLVLSDFKLPGKNGLEFLRELRELSTDVPFLIMTAYGSIEIAVEAMRYGANDFITKPFEPSSLNELIEQLCAHKQIVDRSCTAKSQSGVRFITHDDATKALLNQVKRAAAVDSTILLLGESGTGKELMARYIHEQSSRKEKPFLAVNCAALPEQLLESEFFGHEAGAFTGATQTRIGVLEAASNGTVFLDEIGDMPAVLQVKLLRALQEKEIKRVGGNKTIKVNPRIVAATNVDIRESLINGSLREDFYYRLAVISFEIPALRKRPADIEPLLGYYMDYYAERLNREKPSITKEALALMKRYPWPGNARELENVIERALILSKDSIGPEHLELNLSVDYRSLDDILLTLPELANAAAKQAEVKAILSVLSRTDGNKTQAAKILGVSYKTLLNKIKDYKLSPTA